MHASMKEINKKNIRVFLEGMDLSHTLQGVLYGEIWRRPRGKPGQ
jgi:hypothetical protein